MKCKRHKNRDTSDCRVSTETIKIVVKDGHGWTFNYVGYNINTGKKNNEKNVFVSLQTLFIAWVAPAGLPTIPNS